jgi:hypothetical protein
MVTTLQLSTVAPDFDDLANQLTNALSNQPAWKDRITGAMGTTLVRMIAAIGAYSQYAIESAYQEAWPESAKNKTTLYAAATAMGVRFNRKLPASVQCSLTAPSSMIIPVNSIFVGAGTFWFNRTPLSVGATPMAATLYQGQIVSTTINGIGTDFQAYVTPEDSFQVSDEDVFITVNSVSIPLSGDGLWNYPSLPGAQDFTLPSGQAIFLFGNSLYGTLPQQSDVVSIVYATTSGADGNNVLTLNKSVNLQSNTSVTGTFTTNPSGGANETDPLQYKTLTPALFGSFNSSVTASQYKRLPLTYPGVVDAQTFSQRELNPNALTYMNVITASILPQSSWSTTDWNNFVSWYQARTMYSTRVIRQDPTAYNVTINADIYCSNLSNLPDIQNKVQTALNALFAPRQGILGLDVYRSDIIRAIENADSNIEYVVLNTPAADIVVSNLTMPAPNVIATVNIDDLHPSVITQNQTYTYAISAVTPNGTTSPTNWTTIVAPPGEIANGWWFQLTWTPLAGATSYNIYGRQSPSSLGLLGSTSGTLFVDTGQNTPSGGVPVVGTLGVSYPHLSSTTLNMHYSTRSIKL